jgi:hypothetical protein
MARYGKGEEEWQGRGRSGDRYGKIGRRIEGKGSGQGEGGKHASEETKRDGRDLHT